MILNKPTVVCDVCRKTIDDGAVPTIILANGSIEGDGKTMTYNLQYQPVEYLHLCHECAWRVLRESLDRFMGTDTPYAKALEKQKKSIEMALKRRENGD